MALADTFEWHGACPKQTDGSDAIVHEERMGMAMRNRMSVGAMWTASAVLVVGFVHPSGTLAQARVALDRGEPIEARVWLDRGEEPLLQQGDQVRVYYRAAQDAYVAIFHIDTDGTAALVFPHSPDEDHYVRGGRDYRLLFPRSPYWYVEDQPGLGYYFIVASEEPFDFSSFRFSAYGRGWDLSQVGRQVYRDPYVAMDDYLAALLPDWQTAPYALDFTSYNVGQRHEFPRFLCYQCHAFRAYAAWNPYYTVCTSFRVVIYDDPYFYPARRYRGQRVVWTQPPSADRARFAFKERARGEPASAIVSPRPTPEPSAPSHRSAVQRRAPQNGAGGMTAPSNEPTNLGTVRGRPTQPSAGAVTRGGQPTAVPRDGRPTPVAPPTSAAPRDGTRPVPTRPSDGVRGGVAVPGTGAPPPPADAGQRPVLQRRPSEGSPPPPPSGRPRRGGEPSQPESGTGERPTRPTRPPSSPPPSAEGNSGRSAEPRSEPQSGSETTQSAPPPRSGEKPTVRRTPDGRPVVR